MARSSASSDVPRHRLCLQEADPLCHFGSEAAIGLGCRARATPEESCPVCSSLTHRSPAPAPARGPLTAVKCSLTFAVPSRTLTHLLGGGELPDKASRPGMRGF